MERASVPTWPLAVVGSLVLHATVLTGIALVQGGAGASVSGDGGLAGSDVAGANFETTPIYLLPEELPADVAAALEAERAREALHAAAEPVEPQVDPVKVKLGSENAPPLDTKNWMTSVTEGQHAARLSRVEQPQLDQDAKVSPQGPRGDAAAQGGSGGAAGPAGEKGPEQDRPVEVMKAAAVPEPREKVEGVQGPARAEGPEREKVEAGSAGGAAVIAPVEERGPRSVPAVSEVVAAPVVMPAPAAGSAGGNGGGEAGNGGGGEAGAGTPGAAESSPKVAADRDADASSVRRAAVFRNGRVEAGEGLDIRTVRPSFSLTTRALRTPTSPLMEVVFGRDGRAVTVRVVKSSGFPDDVDRPVVTALYNWRARGKVLEALPTGGTVNLEITVILQ